MTRLLKLGGRSYAGIGILAVCACAPAYLFAQPGDANNDKTIDLADMSAIVDYTIEKTASFTGDADTNENTTIDLADAIAIGRTFAEPDELNLNLGGGFSLDMVRIPAGRYDMGSEGDTGWDDPREAPVHEVTFPVDRAFYMARTEITQGQWIQVYGTWPNTDRPNSTYGMSPTHPAYYISWNNCQTFLHALNNNIIPFYNPESPVGFRLPSESEWERACRAGSTTRFYFGDSNNDPGTPQNEPYPGDDPMELGLYAWFRANSGLYSHPVAEKLPNAYGLYDMHGNMYEWVQDIVHDNYNGAPTDGSAWETVTTSTNRILRGSGWNHPPYWERSAARNPFAPATHIGPDVGFRPVRFVDVPTGAAGTVGEVAISEVAAQPEQYTFVPITIENGTNLTAVLIRLEYDPAVLEYPLGTLGELASSDHVVSVHEPTPGRLNIAVYPARGVEPFISGNGTVASLGFRVNPAAPPGLSPITITTVGTPNLPASSVVDTSGNNVTHNITNGGVNVGAVACADDWVTILE